MRVFARALFLAARFDLHALCIAWADVYRAALFDPF
jgi:hypothetical protein